MSDLFPKGSVGVVVSTSHERLDYEIAGRQVLFECQRCWSWVANTEGHTRWHAAVDTAATTFLPSDSAPRSSGAGRPNPKDPR